MRGSSRWAALALILLAACASHVDTSGPQASSGSIAGPDGAGLPGLSRSILPGYVVHVSTLDATALSADALDPPSLVELLKNAGFEVGREGTFSSRGKALTIVITRVLRFDEPAGAAGYLDWLRSHPADLLGSTTEVSDPPPIPAAIAFAHAPCASCSKDTYWYFAAWTRGPYAVTLRAAGPHAGLAAATPLARALDASVRKDG
ncbi:MAG TPA: hypothetical protein VH989_11410 [Actinomycetota bacterium]